MCANGGAARVPMDHRMTPARSTLAPPTLQVTADGNEDTAGKATPAYMENVECSLRMM